MAGQKAKYLLVIMTTSLLTVCAVLLIQHKWDNRGMIYSKQALSASEEQNYANATGMAPEQMARQFFTACGNEDWNEVAKFIPPQLIEKNPEFWNRFTNGYGGMQIVSLGTPFKGMLKDQGRLGNYPGVWVPYEIRLKNGDVKHWQLAIRCDNPEHRWYWDGGL